MTAEETEALIRPGIPDVKTEGAPVWADFGAGWGNFTLALRRLLGNDAAIHAVDRDADGLRTIQQRHQQQYAAAPLTLWPHDFTQPINLPPLDGLVMANALHFVPTQRQVEVLTLLGSYLKPAGRLIVIEYEMHWPRSWIPYPITSDNLLTKINEAGFLRCHSIAIRQSPSGGAGMYSIMAQNPHLK